MQYKLAIVHTHPIQYNSPFFRHLSDDSFFKVKVFYTWPQAVDGFFDDKFKRHIKWDIPLLEGYDYELVKNVSFKPSSQTFFGTINPGIVSKIKSWEPDGVLVYGWNHFSHLQVMKQLKRKSTIFFRGDSVLLYDKISGFKQKLKDLVLTKIYKNVDYALYVGSRNREYFLHYGLKPDQLILVPHAVENERFYDLDGKYETQAKEWRRQLGISDGSMVFLFAGKFEYRKNLEILLHAFKHFKSLDTYLILVGNGYLENKLKKLAAQRRNIIFLPFQNQSKMPIVYRLADVFVLPSSVETWGLSVNEAMACSRAVLVSDKAGCAVDLVEIGRNGYVFDPHDVDDLIQKMTDYTKSKARKMGKESFKIIQNWTYAAGIENLKRFIKSKLI